MKCISVVQPWATLLVAGQKHCETRTWAIRHRGPLLVHASKKWTRHIADLAQSEPFHSLLADHKPPLGCIVGCVDIIDCYPTLSVGCVNAASAPEPVQAPGRKMYVNQIEYLLGDFSYGRFAWLCQNARRFAQPIPYRGAMGLFDVPDSVVADELTAGAR